MTADRDAGRNRELVFLVFCEGAICQSISPAAYIKKPEEIDWQMKIHVNPHTAFFAFYTSLFPIIFPIVLLWH